MSLEERLNKLEIQYKNLDADMHSLVRVCADTQTIALTNQHDIAGLKVDVTEVKTDVAEMKVSLSALIKATHAGFRRADEQHNEFVRETRERFDKVDERFNQLELLIRQRIPNSQN